MKAYKLVNKSNYLIVNVARTVKARDTPDAALNFWRFEYLAEKRDS